MEKFLSKFYIFAAMAAGMCFGSHYHLLAIGETDDPTDAHRGQYLYMFSFFTFALVYHFIQTVSLCSKKGHIWSRESSLYFR